MPAVQLESKHSFKDDVLGNTWQFNSGNESVGVGSNQLQSSISPGKKLPDHFTGAREAISFLRSASSLKSTSVLFRYACSCALFLG